MLIEKRHAEAARKLRNAYDGGAISPLRKFLTPSDSTGAYVIQEINTRFWQQQGRKVVGRKIGLTSESVQAQLGVNQPDFGVLFEDMSVADGSTIDAALLIQPKAEAEIAFILSEDLPARDLTRNELAEHIETACVAIEIVDSRIEDWKITFADTVADNGSSAMFVLGSLHRPLSELDLLSCKMTLEVDGELVSTGVGSACLGHPLDAALWLANLLSQQGQTMRSGDIILSGALGPMVTLNENSIIRASVEGLGSVSFRYGAGK